MALIQVYIGTITISFFVILFTFPETAGLTRKSRLGSFLCRRLGSTSCSPLTSTQFPTVEQSATLLDGTTVQAKVQDAAKTRVGDLAKAESIEA